MIYSNRFACYPELGNLSCIKGDPAVGYSIYLTGFYCLAFFSGILNLMVIVSIAHFRQLYTRTNLILLNLAISDFLVCSIVIPMEGGIFFFCWRASDYMCIIYFVFVFTVISVSTADMILIALDRYIAICHPLHYSSISLRAYSITLGCCWIISTCYAIGFYNNEVVSPGRYTHCKGKCHTVVMLVSDYVDLSLNYVGPFVLIMILYLRVFIVAVMQARVMRSHITAKGQQQGASSKKLELKAAKNLGFVLFVFLLCYTAYYAISPRVNVHPYLRFTLLYLLYFNSCFNPLLYAVMYPWFRKAVKQILTLNIFKSGSSDASLL